MNKIIIAVLMAVGAGAYYLGQNASNPATPAVTPSTNPTDRPQNPDPQSSQSPAATPSSNTDLIRLESPQEGDTISSPLKIAGEARGNWFFEATFPVVLTNWDGLIIAEGFATAQGDWMTEEFVPFTAELTFENDTTVSNRGSLILKKANASGLPENDDALEITVYFED